MVRIVEELGGAVTWDVEEFRVVFPGGRVVKAKGRSDGLRYVNRKDLNWIRNALMRSHFAGRPLAARTRVTRMVAGGSDGEEAVESEEEMVVPGNSRRLGRSSVMERLGR